MRDQELASSGVTTVEPKPGTVPTGRPTELTGFVGDMELDWEVAAAEASEVGSEDDAAEGGLTDSRLRARKLFFAVLVLAPVVAFLFLDVTARAVRYNLAADPGRQNPLPRPYEEMPIRIWKAFIDGVYPLGGHATALMLVGVGIVGFLAGAFVLTRLAVVPPESAWAESLNAGSSARDPER